MNKFKVQKISLLLDASPWPFLLSMGMLVLTTGAALGMNKYEFSNVVLIYGFWMVGSSMFSWFRDVIREGTFLSKYVFIILTNLKIGFVLFILSEIMFFFAFFWAYFHSSLAPTIEIGSIWPPVGIEVFKAWDVPLFNTMVLLLSGASVTWVQYALIAGLYDEVVLGFAVTLGLSFLFILYQFKEYVGASYGISDGIYGSTFYMLTGFHGFHVMLGTVLLTVSFVRFLLGHYTPKSFLSFTLAAWYWHFVDVVWLGLFIAVYCWGNHSPEIFM